MDYLKAFIVGGLICAVGQILIDKTKLTPARILVTFVVVGVFLQLIKIYQPLVDFAGAGAKGFLGIFTGGLTAASGGIAAALVFGFLVSIIFRSKSKK